jgi:hypothetical protein
MGVIIGMHSSIQIDIVNGDGLLANEQVGNCQGSQSIGFIPLRHTGDGNRVGWGRVHM